MTALGDKSHQDRHVQMSVAFPSPSLEEGRIPPRVWVTSAAMANSDQCPTLSTRSPELLTYGLMLRVFPKRRSWSPRATSFPRSWGRCDNTHQRPWLLPCPDPGETTFLSPLAAKA